jgi:hypothetical protein
VDKEDIERKNRGTKRRKKCGKVKNKNKDVKKEGKRGIKLKDKKTENR